MTYQDTARTSEIHR